MMSVIFCDKCLKGQLVMLELKHLGGNQELHPLTFSAVNFIAITIKLHAHIKQEVNDVCHIL